MRLKLTIKNQLIILGSAAVIALTILAGLSYIAVNNVNKSMSKQDIVRTEFEKIAEMRGIILEITLTAMDIIVDKDEGIVSQERKEFFKESLIFINNNLVNLDKKLADADADADADAIVKNEIRLVNALVGEMEVFSNLLLNDLINAIEEQWSPDRFAHLDDVLDKKGGVIVDKISELEHDAEKELDKITAVVEHDINVLNLELVIVYVLSLIIIIPLMIFIILRITGSINNMVIAMHKLVEGDNTIKIPSLDSGDEISKMAEALQNFKDTAIEADKLAEEQAVHQMQQKSRSETVEKITDGFDTNVGTFMDNLTTSVQQMQSTSEMLSNISDQGVGQSKALTSATGSASNSVSSVAAAAVELSASIDEINKQISHSSNISKNAVEKAVHANEVIQELITNADKIGEVSNLINDIADQINLLALNATIEAARAGDAGKGFAVVANEVKNLANQTASATAEINDHIISTQDQTKNTAEVIENISTTINEMNEITTAISASMEEQGAVTQEIARLTQEADRSTQEVSTAVEEVTGLANKTGESSSEMNVAIEDLANQSEALSTEVHSFLDEIKAA